MAEISVQLNMIKNRINSSLHEFLSYFLRKIPIYVSHFKAFLKGKMIQCRRWLGHLCWISINGNFSHFLKLTTHCKSHIQTVLNSTNAMGSVLAKTFKHPGWSFGLKTHQYICILYFTTLKKLTSTQIKIMG